ncbi:hypothetical protein [Hymenobacter cellulosivorans]|uniref:Uncharacterized protein n=1 Tax=Hymenobacter cellulosivorans TaxID=2932249 RepID=A0ABY4FC24_9BACT|nr:hypothetical protein [Hymenobacter cellulosivorans]UOQ53975.1 hypothetical protein MUN80_04240 [Hymenobacter cellulosivorans]
MDVPLTVQAQANEALQVLNAWLDEAKGQEVEARYGGATYSFLLEAYHAALNYPVDWAEETLETVLPKVEHSLREKYPFLSAESIRRLSGCFAYAWK